MTSRNQSSSHAPNEGPGGCVPWEKHEALRQAARDLISIYIADGDLDRYVVALEDAAGLSQQNGA